MFALPRRRLAASRWREPFFLLWSAAGGRLDRGRHRARGPPGHAADGRLHPAADLRRDLLSGRRRPRSSARSCCVAAGRRRAHRAARPPTLTFQLMALAFAAVMGVWQAYGRERRAAQLSTEHRPRAAVPRRRRDDDRRARRRRARSSRSTAARARSSATARTSCSAQDWFEIAVPDDFRETARASTSTAALAGIQRRAARARDAVLTRAGERRWIAWSGRIVPTRTGDGHADRRRGRHRRSAPPRSTCATWPTTTRSPAWPTAPSSRST